MKSQNSPFLTIKEVSELLGISVSNLQVERNISSKNKLSITRIGFPMNQIDQWIDEKRDKWK